MNALLRSLPALCALFVALGAIVFCGAAMVGVHYHPQGPQAHLILPYFVGSFIAAGLAIVLFFLHLFDRRKNWRKALREMRIGAGAFALAGVLLPFVYRVPDEIIVTYQGQAYAIPRVWNPGVNQAGTTLKVEFCLPSFEPKYASLDCSRSCGAAIPGWSWMRSMRGRTETVSCPKALSYAGPTVSLKKPRAGDKASFVSTVMERSKSFAFVRWAKPMPTRPAMSASGQHWALSSFTFHVTEVP
jgi:hypothetical protein